MVTQPKLSILVCSLEDRGIFRRRLLGCIEPQIAKHGRAAVELLVDIDNKQVTTGAKRNRMIKAARGQFVAFVDDDDMVVDDYVDLIIKAIDKDPTVDCIGMSGIITFNGQPPGQLFTHSISCPGWCEKDGVYLRTPNHLNPIAIGIARQVPYENITVGEDHRWSDAVRPLLKRETKIEKPIYRYLART